MSKKIFVSYKYADKYVRQAGCYEHIDWVLETEGGNYTTVRNYVDYLQSVLKEEYGHINKGERDDESLEDFKDETIAGKLKDKIFDSSITIVLLSKKMFDRNKSEKDQWIPWEISYSLKEITRNNITSKTNALLLIVLPDEDNSYDYAFIKKDCNVISWKTNTFFEMIRENMFNKKDPNHTYCSECFEQHHNGYDHSYAFPIIWDDFLKNPNSYINHVLKLRDNIEEFYIKKNN